MTRTIAPLTAFAVATIGIAVFSGMDAVMKGLVLAIGAYNALLWRTASQMVMSGALYLPRARAMPTKAAMRLHLIRGLLSAIMAFLFFWGLARVPMAQAIALAFIAPLLALFLSAAILKERIGGAAIVASGVAFAGVAVILAGQARAQMGPEALMGALAILVSAVCYAFNIVLMRAQSQQAGPVEITFWQSLIVCALFLCAAPWLLVVPAREHWPMIVLGGFLAVTSLLLLAWAYTHGPASYLAPSEYTSFVWAAILGWIIFDETLSPWTLAGAALIVGGCVLAARTRPAPPVANLEAAA